MSYESGRRVEAAFSDLGSLTEDKALCCVDQMLLYATCHKPSFSTAQVRSQFEVLGAMVPMDVLKESLERLQLAYVLKKQASLYTYAYPLVREYVCTQVGEDARELLLQVSRDLRMYLEQASRR